MFLRVHIAPCNMLHWSRSVRRVFRCRENERRHKRSKCYRSRASRNNCLRRLNENRLNIEQILAKFANRNCNCYVKCPHVYARSCFFTGTARAKYSYYVQTDFNEHRKWVIVIPGRINSVGSCARTFECFSPIFVCVSPFWDSTV